MVKKGVIAAFDFDGTITTRDTFVPFLDRAFGKTQVRLAFASLTFEGLKVSLGLSNRDVFKEKIVKRLFKNKSVALLKRVGEDHAKEIVSLYRQGALERIRWHKERGHRLVMVSASLNLYLEPVARELGFDDLLCTRLSSNALIFDGHLDGANCRRAEKVRLLQFLVGPLKNYEVHAYGDSDGDTEMLAVADTPHFMPFLK